MCAICVYGVVEWSVAPRNGTRASWEICVAMRAPTSIHLCDYIHIIIIVCNRAMLPPYICIMGIIIDATIVPADTCSELWRRVIVTSVRLYLNVCVGMNAHKKHNIICGIPILAH